MSATLLETIIEPDLPIVDAHHHLWLVPDEALVAMEGHDSIASRSLSPVFRRHARYLLDEFMSDLRTGHNVLATVFVDAHAMYRSRGPEEMRSVGEVEFVNGIAAMAASRLFGDVQACAGIVGNVDLMQGDAVAPVLEAHIRAGGDRYRGIRCGVIYDEDERIIGAGAGAAHRLRDERFRAGFKWLHRLGLSFDALILEPQLPELIELARAFPETTIVLNHLGAPVGVGQYANQREARFPTWRSRIATLSQCPNVYVKLGGLGIPFGGFSSFMSTPPANSSQLAKEWQPYVESAIEAFGVERCMFESNVPIDFSTCSYAVMWNAFKRICASASAHEKAALFAGTAKSVYRLDI